MYIKAYGWRHDGIIFTLGARWRWLLPVLVAICLWPDVPAQAEDVTRNMRRKEIASVRRLADNDVFQADQLSQATLPTAQAKGYPQAHDYCVEAMRSTLQLAQEQSSEHIMRPAQRYEVESKLRRIRELTHQNERHVARQQLLLITLFAILFLLAGAAWFLCRLRHSHLQMVASHGQLQQMRDHQQSILDALPDLLFELDPDGRYHDFHTMRTDLLAVPPEALLGKTVPEVLPPEAANICMAALREAEEKGTSFGKQYMLTLAGKECWFELSVACKNSIAGEVQHYIVLSRDITALKETERSLAKSYVQLRELAVSQQVAREEERRLVARELHDELGQMLTAIRMETSMLKLRFLANNAHFQQKVTHIVSLVDKTIGGVRDVVSLLHPPALERGIVDALEWLVDGFKERTGIQCTLNLDNKPANMADSHASAIFRIVQESLTNVARHSGADTVHIQLRHDGAGYHLVIRDNGRGFDPATQKKTSMGLAGMRERVNHLHGSLAITSAPGQGVRLEIHLPTRAPIPANDDIKINE